jgi:hypothetical protein
MTKIITFFTGFLLFCSVNCVKHCYKTCENSFSLHTSDQVAGQQACLRGCRFYRLNEYLRIEDQNATHCIKDCTSAYGSSELASSCQLGCKSSENTNTAPGRNLQQITHGLFGGLHLPQMFQFMFKMPSLDFKMPSMDSIREQVAHGKKAFMEEHFYVNNNGHVLTWSRNSNDRPPHASRPKVHPEPEVDQQPLESAALPLQKDQPLDEGAMLESDDSAQEKDAHASREEEREEHKSWLRRHCDRILHCLRMKFPRFSKMENRWTFLLIMSLSVFLLVSVWWSLVSARKRRNQQKRHNFNKVLNTEPTEKVMLPTYEAAVSSSPPL